MIFFKSTRRKEPGFSIIEALVAIVIILTGFLVVISLAAASLRYATQSRNRVYAYLVGESTLEYIKAHRYGDPEPAFWQAPDVYRYTIEGNNKPAFSEFRKNITYQNGSFVGKDPSNRKFDLITITISWVEGTGEHGQSMEKSFQIQTEVRTN